MSTQKAHTPKANTSKAPPKGYLKRLTACLSWLLVLAVCAEPLVAIAQEYKPPKRGTPGRREGAGTRGGGCLRGSKLLMPLTPSDSFSATVSNSPTFFWYVPITVAQTAEFALLDNNDQPLYKTTIALPNQPGIVGFSLPTAIAASVLEVGKDYRWQFSLVCNPNQPSMNPFVEGVVQRVQPESALISQLDNANLYDRPAIYAAAGIWQDAIAAAAEQRCIQPQNLSLMLSWSRLLRSVKLEEFAQEPLTQACLSMTTQPQP